jgi:amidase
MRFLRKFPRKSYRQFAHCRNVGYDNCTTINLLWAWEIPVGMHDNTEDLDMDRRSLLALAAGATLSTAAYASPRRARTGQPSELVMLDAVSLSAAIHTRKVSCVEVMSAYLTHIDQVNPHVTAIVALQDRALLLPQAEERDRQLARGESMGFLHGFPHAVKDLQPVKGIRSTQGSLIFKDFVPTTDSLMVDRLRKAGVIFIGKTNAPEFGLGSHTYNAVYGATRNAYDQSRSAGGSSGGAAVSLALRMLPVADGTDYGGSLRNPAGWNNVFGFRTSYGCVPNDARDQWLPTMAVAGPMARNVSDLAMLLSVQAGPDARVPYSMDAEASRFEKRLDKKMAGKRIAWCGDFKGVIPHDKEVLEVCVQSLKTFQSLGCVIEEAQPDYSIEAVWNACLKIRAWQQGGNLVGFYNDPIKRQMLKPEAIYEIELGLKQSAMDISAASAVRTEWFNAVRRFFESYDYLIMPTAQVMPFDVAQHWPSQVGGQQMQTYHEWMKGTFVVTMSGCPALAAPAGFSAGGLPMGIQIVAPLHHEMECLQLAYAYDLASAATTGRLPSLISS